MATSLKLGDVVTLKSGQAGPRTGKVVHLFTDDLGVRCAFVKFDNGRRSHWPIAKLALVARRVGTEVLADGRLVPFYRRVDVPAGVCGNCSDTVHPMADHDAPTCGMVVFDTGGVRCALAAGHEGEHDTMRWSAR